MTARRARDRRDATDPNFSTENTVIYIAAFGAPVVGDWAAAARTTAIGARVAGAGAKVSDAVDVFSQAMDNLKGLSDASAARVAALAAVVRPVIGVAARVGDKALGTKTARRISIAIWRATHGRF